MSDPGLSSALGIEAVQWFAQDGVGEGLTVSVTGRWRRRRPASIGQPTLVVDVHGYRHRYPAMPEPPSLSGTAPGTWRISFSVPAWIAPHLGSRASLQLGGVVIPLPAQVEAGSVSGSGVPGEAADGGAGDPDRAVESLEIAAEAARHRARESERAAAELTERVRRLEGELELAAREPARLNALVAIAERARLAAEQRAHAERHVREEIQDELARLRRGRGDPDGARAELEAARTRAQELEGELIAARRRLDQAEHRLAAARAAPARALDGPVESVGRVAHVGRIARGTRAELAVAFRTPAAPAPSVAAVAAPPRDALALALERSMTAGRAVRLATLEREAQMYAARCARAYDAIGRLRDQLDGVRRAVAPAAAEPEVADAPGPIDADRLDAARSRLRETSPELPVDVSEPIRERRSWLGRVFRRRAKRAQSG